MHLGKRRRFIYGVVAWMLGVIIVLASLGSLKLELFFVFSVIGLVIVIELTAPFTVSPRWRRRLIPVIMVGLAGFGYVAIQRIIGMLPGGIV